MILCIKDGVAKGYLQSFEQIVYWVEANSRTLTEVEVSEFLRKREISIEGVRYGYDEQAEYH